MPIIDAKGTEAWVEKISKQELPAFAATVKRLEKLAEDDTASLPALGKAVLHDQGLTARILRVVNSVTYGLGGNRVTTVSRAAVILGYNTLKQICITAKMVDSLLRNKDITQPVYERLLRAMARGFHSAMIARMLIGDRSEYIKEEVYIAALLHELGEIAFWSTGGRITEDLDKALRESKGKPEEVVKQFLGTSFKQLGAGLADAWNMGETLVRSIQDLDSKTPEMRAVGLATRYCKALGMPESGINVEHCLKDMTELTGLTLPKLKTQLKHCTEQSLDMAVSYGAKSLTKYLDPDADISCYEQEEVIYKSDEMTQLKLLRELTLMANEHADLNLVVNTTIEGLHRGVGMDRVMVFMLNQAKDKLKPRFVSCNNAERIEAGFVYSLDKDKSLFDEVYKSHKSFWVETPRSEKWRTKLTPMLLSLCQGSPFMLGPLLVNKKCIGLIYADRAETLRLLTQSDFEAFNHFTAQLSLCLSIRFSR